MGGAEGLSPTVDALAARGALFRQAITNGPRTPSAFPAIMCSLYPFLSGEQGVPESATTLAEAMHAAGYRTAGFNLDNPYLAAACGYGRGFEQFEDFWNEDCRDQTLRSKRRGPWGRAKKAIQSAIGRRDLAFLLFFQLMFVTKRATFTGGRRTTDKAIEWTCKDRDAPFFCWLHYMDVHFPYLPANMNRSLRDRCGYVRAMLGILAGSYGYALRRMRDLYNQKVALVDSELARLMNALRARGLDENTLIMVTSDHGEMFREHGGYTHGPQPYDELLRVPLIFAGPGIPPGRVVEQQMGLIDLAPTLLDFAGIARPDGYQGRSARRLIESAEEEGTDCIFSEASHRGGRRSRQKAKDKYRIVSCRTPDWKYIFDDEGPTRELYDLHRDPTEQHNLVDLCPDRTQEMHARVLQHLEELDREAPRYHQDAARWEMEKEEAVRERLSALGYL